VNDSVYEEECLHYINRLSVPEGYEIEQLSVWEAASMASGYNEGMNASDAKYKVYLHQDVFLTNKNFISDLLAIFEDETIGMVGMVGSPKMPEDCVMWSSDRVGYIYSEFTDEPIGAAAKPYTEVEAVDGLLIATQADIPWRDDLFKGWDFYDVSQSAEFRKKGYRVVVPYVEKPWCLHDDGFSNLEHYFEWRDVFKREYGALGTNQESSDNYICTYESYSKNVLQYKAEAEEYIARLDKCLAQKTGKSAQEFMDIVTEDELCSHCIKANQKLCYAVIFPVITSEEIKRGRTSYFIFNGNSLDELIKIFKQLEFCLWELEFEGGVQAEQRFCNTVRRYGITVEATYCAISFVSKNTNDIINKVTKIHSENIL
jgi:hypothetical protein